jgi:uncharacterized membrane protein YhaH (DUF805 family)
MDRFSFVWFHFNGRIGRVTWLVFAVSISMLELVAESVLRRALHWPPPPPVLGNAPSTYIGDGISVLAALIFLWPSLAIDVKRWHDIGRSGWYTLVMYAPASALYVAAFLGMDASDKRVGALFFGVGMVAIAYFIILAARRGEEATNRFGEPPP